MDKYNKRVYHAQLSRTTLGVSELDSSKKSENSAADSAELHKIRQQALEVFKDRLQLLTPDTNRVS